MKLSLGCWQALKEILPVSKGQKRNPGLEIGKRECLLFGLFFLSSISQHCSTREKNPNEKTNLSGQKNWENRASVIQKVWGIPIIFFPHLSPFPTSLKGNPTYRGAVQCKSKGSAKHLSETGNKALETEAWKCGERVKDPLILCTNQYNYDLCLCKTDSKVP